MSAPDVSPASRRAPSVWTPQRLKLVQSMWERGVPAQDIFTAVKILPGEPICSLPALYTRIAKAGWKRPSPALSQVAPVAETPPAVVEPRNPNGNIWTSARLQLLRQLWEEGVAKDEIFARICQLPGTPPKNPRSLASAANAQGFTRPAWFGSAAQAQTWADRQVQAPRIPIPALPGMEELPPSTSSAVLNCITGDRAEAEALFAKGMTGREVAEELDLPLGFVARWIGEWRQRQQQGTPA